MQGPDIPEGHCQPDQERHRHPRRATRGPRDQLCHRPSCRLPSRSVTPSRGHFDRTFGSQDPSLRMLF